MNIAEYVEKLRISDETLDSQILNYTREMGLGLEGLPSSLRMLPLYLSQEHEEAAGKRVLAVDIGGTNLRVARVSFDREGVPSVESVLYAMPGVKSAVTAAEFFDAVAGYMEPVAGESDRVGVCFSFPCEIGPDLDGRILEFDKEVKVLGAEGEYVAEGLRKALARRSLPHEHKIAVTNDAAAALLAGMAGQHAPCGGHIGFILGTGVNCCYAEQNSNIKKSPYLRERPGGSLINMESGGYAGLPGSDVDIAFDANTRLPGDQLFEKMISGAYLGSLFTSYIADASKAGCFSENMSRFVAGTQKPFETKDIAAFMRSYSGGGNGDALSALCGGSRDDRAALARLADAFCDRAARFVAISLCGIMNKVGMGLLPEKPVIITAEGGTFSKFGLLREKILDGMYRDAKLRYGLHCRFQEVENATLVGAALAALAWVQ